MISSPTPLPDQTPSAITSGAPVHWTPPFFPDLQAFHRAPTPHAFTVPHNTHQPPSPKAPCPHRTSNSSFREVLEKLESDPICQRLSLKSFLILPFQRITRLKLLLQVEQIPPQPTPLIQRTILSPATLPPPVDSVSGLPYHHPHSPFSEIFAAKLLFLNFSIHPPSIASSCLPIPSFHLAPAYGLFCRTF